MTGKNVLTVKTLLSVNNYIDNNMNLKEETICGFKVSALSKQVWSIQMEMLKHLLSVCEKYNLKIWAEGGTLLGTIRHKGFIPWDDDIDMMMLRDDYEKLLKVAPKEFSYPLFFQAPSTDPGYARGHAQLRRSDTTGILPNDIGQPFNQGIFIDIFVFDFLPSTEEERTKTFAELETKRRRLLRRNYNLPYNLKTLWYKIVDTLYFGINGYYNKYKEMEDLIVKHENKSDYLIGDVLWTSFKYHKYMREIEWYRDTIMLPFEDMEIPVPIDYDKILKTQYGDYMTPVEAPSNHGSIVIDIHKSYIDSMKKLYETMNWKHKVIRFLTPGPAKN